MAGAGEISGHVTSAADSKPVEGIEVCAVAVGPVEGEGTRGCSETGATGEYTIPNLTAAMFTVEFGPGRFGRNLERQYYKNRSKLSEADQVKVTAGQTTEGINAAMQPGAQISGEVGFALGVGPLPELVEVCAISVDAVREESTCTGTEANGKYTIGSLESGAYLVAFLPSRSPFAPQYFDDGLSFAEAQYVNTTVGATTANVDATLAKGGTIKGQVRDATSGAPIKDVFVCPETIDGDRLESDNCANSAENGLYELTGLVPGDTRLSASGGPSDLSPQLYSNRYEFFEADLLPVSVGVALTAEFHLGHGGTISGKVTSALTKTPLQGIFVCAREPESLVSGDCETTEAGGTYALEGLPPGSYTLEFEPEGESEYAAQYYNAHDVPAQGERIAVGPGSEVHADAALKLGGSVSGQVTAAVGQTPIGGVVVCAWFASAEEASRCNETDSGGRYLLTGLPEGRYKIHFDDFFGELNVAPQFFSGRASYGEADEITVTANHATLNINASVGQGAEIKGAVTDAETGLPVWGYLACAYEADGEQAGCTETDDNGDYTITSLQGGDYLVRFQPSNFSEEGSVTRFAEQFYKSAPGEGSAIPVAVPAGGVTTGINASLKASSLPVGDRRPGTVGTPVPGATLGERHAEWLNEVRSFVYQWERCGASGGSCEAIEGADSRHYTVVAADGGHRLRVSETAISPHGPSQPEHSDRTAVVPAPPPPGGGGSETPGPIIGGPGPLEGGPLGKGGTLSKVSNLPSASEIIQALLASLGPAGKEARVAALRKHGGYKLSFLAPSAGTLSIGWYEVPKGAHLSKAKPVLLAVGTATTTKAGKLTIIVKLNPKGKAVLKHGGKPKLTAKGTFTPAGGTAVSATKAFTLH